MNSVLTSVPAVLAMACGLAGPISAASQRDPRTVAASEIGLILLSERIHLGGRGRLCRHPGFGVFRAHVPGRVEDSAWPVSTFLPP